MSREILFSPLLGWPVLIALGALAAVLLALALWRGLAGAWWRAGAVLLLLAALSGPQVHSEARSPLADIVFLLTDQSASQRLADRREQSAAAVRGIEARLKALPGIDLRKITIGDGPGDTGTLLMTALAKAMAKVPRERIAGGILITDGQVHDVAQAPDFPAPLNVLLTGHAKDWDRRLVIRDAPAFAILGEKVTLTLAIEDQGAVPRAASATVPLEIAIDGGAPQRFTVPVGRDIKLPLKLPHGGINVLSLTVPPAPGELTARNNSAVLRINGVRDRLRVLLISGAPYQGERTWRNLLKSDSAVDLVHFTILRPPDKQDGVPVDELSLIAFPVRELFIDKIDQFDLIIFDHYPLRGILPSIYLENVRAFVERGGAVLVAAGPDFASADSLARSPLGDILPARPTGRVLERGFTPLISRLGRRHPVTEGLAAFAPRPALRGKPGWGRWFRQIEVIPRQGSETLMTGIGARPLLLLSRVGKGRVALIASDQAWLWSRGYEGGGPQLELLRRLAHWAMKEPELEEEALSVSAAGQTMSITRRTLGNGPRTVRITAPDGRITDLPLAETGPGRFTANWRAPAPGLYRLSEGARRAVAALGPAAPREFKETIASGAKLAGPLKATRGGVHRLEKGLPTIRFVRAGRPASGRGWIGLTRRGAYRTTELRLIGLVSPWLFLLLVAGLMLAGWLSEKRR